MNDTISSSVAVPEPSSVTGAPADFAISSSSEEAAATTTGITSGIIVSLVQSPTAIETGVISVTVPKGMTTDGVGFRIPIPTEALKVVNSEKTALTDQSSSAQSSTTSRSQSIESIVEVNAIIDGHAVPLPSWISYMPEQQVFVVTAVPDGALPITLEIKIAGQRTLLVISERT